MAPNHGLPERRKHGLLARVVAPEAVFGPGSVRRVGYAPFLPLDHVRIVAPQQGLNESLSRAAVRLGVDLARPVTPAQIHPKGMGHLCRPLGQDAGIGVFQHLLARHVVDRHHRRIRRPHARRNVHPKAVRPVLPWPSGRSPKPDRAVERVRREFDRVDAVLGQGVLLIGSRFALDFERAPKSRVRRVGPLVLVEHGLREERRDNVGRDALVFLQELPLGHRQTRHLNVGLGLGVQVRVVHRPARKRLPFAVPCLV